MLLCAFGDSIAFGVHLRERETLLYKLGQKFGCRTLNASVPGNTAKQGLMRIDEDVLHFKPDVCVVEFGMNDHYAVDVDLPNLPLSDYRHSLMEIVWRLKAIDCVPILCTVQPVILGDEYAYYYKRHPHSWYQSPPSAQAWIESYSNEVRAFAAQENVRLADIAQTFADYQAGGGNLFDVIRNLDNCADDDGVHPTSEGVDLYVECIAKQVRGILAQGTMA